MRMKRLIIILLSVAISATLSLQVNAQNREIDSLTRLLQANMTDSARVDVLTSIAKGIAGEHPDSTISIGMTAKTLAEKIGYQKGVALAAKQVGYGYYLQGKYREAFKLWQQSLEAYQAIGDKKGVANMLSNQGAIFFNQGDEAKSLELHLQSLKLSEEINDTLRIVTSLNNIGGIYQNKAITFQKALENFMRSYTLSHLIHDDYLIGTAAVNLGEFYFKKGSDSIALVYLKEAAKLYEGTENLPYSLNYIGRVYTREGDFPKAITTHQQAVAISQKLDLSLDMTQSLVGLAQAYFAKGDVNEAITTYHQALEYARPLKALTEMKDAFEGLTTAYKRKSDFANAVKYQDSVLAIRTEMYNIDIDQKLATMQLTFDIEKKTSEISLLNKDKQLQQQAIRRQKLVRNGFMGGFAVVLLFAGVFLTQRNKINRAKKRSEELLLNILPEETAEELKNTGEAKAKSFEMVSVLFTDFKNFTQASEHLSPEELVAEINFCYSEFDRIITRHGIEKIKTIGDSYMCAGGLPVTNSTHPYDIVAAGLEMAEFIERNKKEKVKLGHPTFDLRIGVHSGPVVAGIVGIKKFSYDIWGDTVNTASRMESSGQIGRVNISEVTYELIKDVYACTHRGKLEAKNKGLIDMYFVDGIGEEAIKARKFQIM
jgi:adenylate cyclase